MGVRSDTEDTEDDTSGVDRVLRKNTVRRQSYSRHAVDRNETIS